MDGRVGVPPGPPPGFSATTLPFSARDRRRLAFSRHGKAATRCPGPGPTSSPPLREPGESYSDVILRLVELETGRRLGTLLAVCRQSVIGRSLAARRRHLPI